MFRWGRFSNYLSQWDYYKAIIGTRGHDTLTGGVENDAILGLDGDDTLIGGGGNDILIGGHGHDTLDGQSGSDTYIFRTRDRDDDTWQDTGTDGGVDTLDASDVSRVTLSDQFNHISSGIEVIVGLDTDIISTGPAVNWDFSDITLVSILSIKGSGGEDIITGSASDDVIIGDGGDDVLSGGDGNDVLKGGVGQDTLDGGAGSDTYVLGRQDQIPDTFQDTGAAGVDTLDASGVRSAVLIDEFDHASTGLEVIQGSGTDLNAAGGQVNWNFTDITLVSVRTIKGSNGNDVIVGSAGNDVIDGGQGRDLLDGGLGNDRMSGGSGNDIIIYDAADSYRVDGGRGTDTLRVTGDNTTLDIRNIAGSILRDIEIIDLAGAGNHTLILSQAAVKAISSSSNTLRIMGGAGDTVALGNSWVNRGEQDIDGQTYTIYTNRGGGTGRTTIQLQADIGVRLASDDVNDVTEEGPGTVGDVFSNDVDFDHAGVAVTGVDGVVDDAVDIVGCYGSLNWASDGSYSYTVDNGNAAVQALGVDETLTDTFNFILGYTLSDGDISASSSLTITIDGVNDAPVNSVPAAQATGFLSNLILTGLSVADVDIGENDLSITLSTDIGSLTLSSMDGLSFTNGDGSDDAAMSFSGSVSDINTALAGIVFHAVDIGTATVSLTSTDEEDASDTDTISITINPTMELSSLLASNGGDGSNGFVINGIDAVDYSGHSVASAGDVNGDGFDDLIIGGWGGNPNGSATGESYVVFGKASGFAASLNLSTLNGSNGFVINGIDANDQSGWSVASAGDVNGDGFDDLIIGARYADPNGSASGESYVVFGKVSGFAASLNLSTLNGSNGFVINGIDGSDWSGWSVASAGDLNGDGFADLIIGAAFADPNGSPNGSVSGESYVVFGKASGFAASLNLSTLDGSNGFIISGNDVGDASGWSVDSAGDVNGDGFADLIIGARYADPNGINRAGESYVVFGKASGFAASLDLSTLNGSNGFVINGIDADDQSGNSVASAGDVNGDGFDDLIIGARFADPNGSASGESYVVFGKVSGFAASLNLSTLNGSNGFVINGIDADDQSGHSVASAGDVNGDGFDDLIIGARLADPNVSNSGESYVVFGKASGFAASFNLSSLNGTDGFVINGIDADDQSGNSVASAGDINGDGFDDLIIGATYADPNGIITAGESYVLFGGDFTEAVTIDGGNGNDSISGTSLDDVIVGGTGNDTLDGGDGDDVLKGGAGDDIVIYDAADTLDVDGGSGVDTLQVNGGNINLVLGDLTAVSNIEIIDLNGSGANSLSLTALEVLNLSDTTNTLRIIGNTGDSVIADSEFWLNMGTVIIEGQDYTEYQHGQAILQVVDLVGRSGINTSQFELSSLNGSNGFVLDGIDAGDRSGASVASAGDINGDGFDDLIIGASNADPNGNESGESYVVFGKASGFAASLNLSSLDGTNGFVLNGIDADDRSGASVALAGDINGDGFDDLIIGARFADPNGGESGESYVVFGQLSGFAASLNLSSLDGTNGFVLNGIDAADRSGASVASAGDINGDGFDDLIIGASRADPNGSESGESYVVFGHASGFAASFNLSSLDGTNGFVLNGIDPGDYSGAFATSAGDINGDGFDDIIIGARRADPNGDESGESYVVFGKASGFAASLNLSSLDGTNGFVLNGIDAGDRSGDSVSSAGDINGDGFDDLIIGGSAADPNGSYSGESYVVFGKASGFVASFNLSSLNGSNGFVLNGIDEYDQSGFSVASAGDINGDGFDDLIIGAVTADPSGSDSGVSYVVFGGDFTGAVTIDGGDGNDNISGTSLNDVIIGGTGNDTLNGNAGNDALRGGTGEDVLVYDAVDTLAVDGGSGEDTLQVNSSDRNLVLGDLTAVSNIEIIDLNSSGANSLTLTALDVLNLSDSTNTLRIMGNSADTVIANSEFWYNLGTVSIEGQDYTEYQHGQAIIQVANLVNRSEINILQFELSSLDGSNGFVLYGIDEGDQSGRSVSSAGDVNGDGIDDFIIGAWVADTSEAENAGESYVVFGKASGFSGSINLSTLNGTNGFVLNGIDAGDQSGQSVASAGDINGDGIDDLIIGAFLADPHGIDKAGESYVVFGTDAGFEASLNLSILNGMNGFILNGIDMNDISGVSSGGDINGDGYNDVIIGAMSADPNETENAGESYVVFGKASGFAANFDLSGLDGTNGFILNGIDVGDRSGRSVSLTGDFNGDGFHDLIIGASYGDPNGRSNSGESYVVFGKASGFSASVNLSTLDGTNGFVLNGVSAGAESGQSVSSAGDINGDGFDDLIIGAFRAAKSYVVFGKGSCFGASINLSALNGTDGFVLNGINGSDHTGQSVSSAGDFNGDGFDDLIVGAPVGTGASYVVFGKASGFNASINLFSLNGSNGFVLYGIDAGDTSGTSVSSAGDINGDGFDDLIVGAPHADNNGITTAGESYVVFGGNFTGAVSFDGGGGNDTIIGTSLDDVIIGGTGNDILDGGGGNDVLNGGAGDDRFLYDAEDTFRVEGGLGLDTLYTAGAGNHIDLTEINQTANYHLYTGIEIIDLTGGINDQLFFDAQDILHLSDSSNTLRIRGGSMDIVKARGDWEFIGTVEIDGVEYHEYQSENAVFQAETGNMRVFAFPEVIELAELNGTNGIVINGTAAVARSGWSVSSAGDINDDGFDDIIIGAPWAEPNGDSSGASYVVFGTSGGLSSSLELSALDGTNGFVLNGVAAVDKTGWSVSSAGDFNSDGYDDILISAPGSIGPLGSSGSYYVVYGKSGEYSPSQELSDLDFSNGFASHISQEVESGVAVSSAGDINGDGSDDILIGISGAGESHIIYGPQTVPPDILGMTIISGAYDGGKSGWSVSSAGDMNGDGLGDIIIGSPWARPNGDESGQTHVIFGIKTEGLLGPIDLTTLDGSNGFTINGVDSGNQSGYSVSSAGDFNGDGYNDIIIGAPFAGPIPAGNGYSYVVFGKAAGFEPVLELSSLDGSNGFAINGVFEVDQSGWSVSSAGDFNGDGYDDLLIGAPLAVPNGDSSGQIYIVYGTGQASAPVFELSSLDGTNGIVLNGPAEVSHSGWSVSSAGDFNGDGYDDVIIGAPEAEPNGAASGQSFVVFGGDYTDLVTVEGGTSNEVIAGSVTSEIVIGGAGNDTISGNGSDDLLKGGSGNDILNGGSGSDKLEGDHGNDIFVFDSLLGTGNVDWIRDFEAADDQIRLDNIIFTSLSEGTLAAANFQSTSGLAKGTAPVASDSDNYVLYNHDAGELYYDADANGSGSAVLFATLDPRTALIAGDFDII